MQRGFNQSRIFAGYASRIGLHLGAILVYNFAAQCRIAISMAITAAPKSVIGLSIGLLALATIFGALNAYKVKSLRGTVSEANAVRATAERSRVEAQKARESAMAGVKAKAAENEIKTAKAEAELVQLQTEKADLQTKLQANQTELASLQKK